jgi:predicted membrane channel-forming protein YqfA (hemolysin III family)
MIKKKPVRPSWIILYLLLATFMYLFHIEVKESLSSAEHVWAEIGLVILFYGLTAYWLNANEMAMMMEDRKKKEAKEQVSHASTEQSSVALKGPEAITVQNKTPLQLWVLYRRGLVPTWVAAAASFLGNFFNHTH